MAVHIELVKGRIWIRSNQKLKKLSNRIPGATWATHPEPRWSVPPTLEVCQLLRNAFGRELVIGDELRAWAQAEKLHRAQLKRIADSHDGWPLERLPELYPELAEAVSSGRPYQSSGVAFAALGQRTLLADTVGLGKTLVVLGAPIEGAVDGPYLLSCPKTAIKSVWGRHLWDWLPDHHVTLMPEGRERRDAAVSKFLALSPEEKTKAWLVINPEVVRSRQYWKCTRKDCGVITPAKKRKSLDCGHDPRRGKLHTDHEFPELFDIPWGGIYLDESDRQILQVTARPNMTRLGMQKLKPRSDVQIILVSATPFRSRPRLMFSNLSFLFPKQYTSMGNWADMFWDSEAKDFNPHARTYTDLRADREAMLHRSLDGVMIRRTRIEVASHLPPRSYVGSPYNHTDPNSAVGIWLPMSGQQERAYREIERMGAARVKGGSLDAIGSLAELTRMRQLASSYVTVKNGEVKPCLPSNKFDYLTDALMPELGFPDEPQKLVIVSEYTSLLRMFAVELRKKFNIKVVGVTGAVTGVRRDTAIEHFMREGEAPWVMMLNTKAGGSSIGLDVADHMVILDQPPIDDDLEQVEGRIDNRRQEIAIRPRFYYYLLSEDSVDVGMANINAYARKTGRDLLDGRRGVTYVRRVVEMSSQQPSR